MSSQLSLRASTVGSQSRRSTIYRVSMSPQPMTPLPGLWNAPAPMTSLAQLGPHFNDFNMSNLPPTEGLRKESGFSRWKHWTYLPAIMFCITSAILSAVVASRSIAVRNAVDSRWGCGDRIQDHYAWVALLNFLFSICVLMMFGSKLTIAQFWPQRRFGECVRDVYRLTATVLGTFGYTLVVLTALVAGSQQVFIKGESHEMDARIWAESQVDVVYWHNPLIMLSLVCLWVGTSLVAIGTSMIREQLIVVESEDDVGGVASRKDEGSVVSEW